MTGLLASVFSLDEALTALAAEADIIDLKDPVSGALGKLDIKVIDHIVFGINGRCLISATIGDLPMEPDIVCDAVKEMAKTGVDYIKIGFFPGGDWPGTIEKLAQLSQQGLALIAVLFADAPPDFAVIDSLKTAGFKGVMLDTMDKKGGSLTRVITLDNITQFVRIAKKNQLLSGLAGSLSQADIKVMMACNPDYLGFRGALCPKHNRTGQLDKALISQIKLDMECCKARNNPLHAENISPSANDRILVVDDSEINLLLMASILENNGYKVDSAISGMDALQLIKENHYKLAFIDFNMPEMSGVEVVKILRAQKHPLITVAFSTFSDDNQMIQVLEAGFDYCLPKPVEEDQMIGMINIC